MPPGKSNSYLPKKLLEFAIIGMLFCSVGSSSGVHKQSKVDHLRKIPLPTKETLPYVAEELGATSYVESFDEDPKPVNNRIVPVNYSSNETPLPAVKRVPRKLTTSGLTSSDNSLDNQEYQGVFGKPGVDFPILSSIPVTRFSCRQVKNSNAGYYADLETNCQVFHVCDGGRKISFLCPNGTIFRQSHLICDWWFRVDCERSPELYEESAEHLTADQNVYKERAEAIAKAMQKALKDNETRVTDVANSIDNNNGNRIYKNQFNSESELPNKVPFFSSPEKRTKSPQQSQTTTTSSENYPNLREQQIPAESASFTGHGDGKYNPYNNYYYFNYVRQTDGRQKQETDTTTTANELTNGNIDAGGTSTSFPYHQIENSTVAYHSGVADQTRYAEFDNTINENQSGTGSETTTSALLNSNGNSNENDNSNINNGTNEAVSIKPAISEILLTSNLDSSASQPVDDENNNGLRYNAISNLLTKMTKDVYRQIVSSKLGNSSSDGGEDNVNHRAHLQEAFVTTPATDDLYTEHSFGLVQTKGSEKFVSSLDNALLPDRAKLKNSADLRELAQVFSRALSAYLENPEQFRRILSEVRPTEPTAVLRSENGEAPSHNEEVLAFSEDFQRQTKNPTSLPSSQEQNTNDFTVIGSSTSTEREIRDPSLFAEQVNDFMNNAAHAGNSVYSYGDSSEITNDLAQTSPTFDGSQEFSKSNNIDSYASFTTNAPSPAYDGNRENGNNERQNYSPANNGFNNDQFAYTESVYSTEPYQFTTYNPVSASSESDHVFVAEDTQSFLSRDNLLKYQLKYGNPNDYSKYSFGDQQQFYQTSNYDATTGTTIPPSNLYQKYSNDSNNEKTETVKTEYPPAYYYTSNVPPQSELTTLAPYYISSFADANNNNSLESDAEVPRTNEIENNENKYNNEYFVPTATASSGVVTTVNNFDRQTKWPQFGRRIIGNDRKEKENSTQSLIDMMNEAKANSTVRRQLVLLLVADKTNKTADETKSRILNALVKNPNAVEERLPYDESQNNIRPSPTTDKSYDDLGKVSRSVDRKPNRYRIVRRNKPRPSPIFISNFSDDAAISNIETNQLSTRNRKSTAKEEAVVGSTNDEADQKVQSLQSDNRAVDLLKSLYSLAANFNN